MKILSLVPVFFFLRSIHLYLTFSSNCPSRLNAKYSPDDPRKKRDVQYFRFSLFFVLVCKSLICLNRKTCMIEDGIGVCRCLFNCTSDQNLVRILCQSLIISCFDFMSHSRFVLPMDWSIKIYVNWNELAANKRMISSLLIQLTVSCQLVFVQLTNVLFSFVCGFFYWLIVNIIVSF